jgi:hypothetical protein
MNPKEEILEYARRNELLAVALEENNGKEARCAWRKKSGDNECRCFLTVVVDVWAREDKGATVDHAFVQAAPDQCIYRASAWFGWGMLSNRPVDSWPHFGSPIMGPLQLNDNLELSHEDIAIMVRACFVKPFTDGIPAPIFTPGAFSLTTKALRQFIADQKAA